MAALKFGNWQSFLDQQTQNTPDVEKIIPTHCTENVFVKVFQHDTLRSCHWISDYFQGITNAKKTGSKSEQLANTFRSQGNLAFKKKNYGPALEKYNSAILNAERFNFKTGHSDRTSELALSYGNRSAVYFHKELYEECLSDIQAALISGYPSSLQCKLYSRQAQCYIRQNRRELAETALCQAQRYVRELDNAKQETAAADISKLQIEAQKLPSAAVASTMDKVSPVPVQGFHPVVTQASAALDLKCDQQQGRHLVANCDIKMGEVLLVEKPYASVLLPDHYASHCHHCYVRLTAFYPCRQCVVVKFCSIQCEEQAWSTYHFIECPYQDLLHSIGIAHLSLRVILTAGLTYLLDFKEQIGDRSSFGGGIPGLTPEGRYERNYLAVYALMPHTENMQPEDLMQYALTARLLLQVLENSGYFSPLPDDITGQSSCDITNGEKEIDKTMKHLSLDESSRDLDSVKIYIGSLLLRHICQLVCNAHAITEMQLSQGDVSKDVDTQTQERIATAIYPTTSLLNHSCQPTIINSFTKNTLVVRALKSVRAGEQIYNCYGPHSARMEYRERQSMLKTQYFFTCQCSACEDQGQQEALYTALACRECNGPVAVTSDNGGTCQHCQSVMNSSEVMVQVKRDEKAFLTAVKLMDEGNLKECMSELLKTLASQSRLLYVYNRDLSQTKDAVAKCYAMAGDYTQAVPYLRQAMAVTEKIYGADSIEAGYELQKYAELLLRAGQKEACFQATQRAVNIFQVYYGKEHPVLEDLNKLLLVARYS